MDKFTQKIIATILIGVFAIWLLYLLKNFLVPIFIAIILSFLTYPIYKFLLKKTRRKILSALIVIFGVLLILLVPISAMAGFFLNYIVSFNFGDLDMQKYEQIISDITGQDIMFSEGIANFGSQIKNEIRMLLPKIITFTSEFLISILVMFFVMFYLLIQKDFFLNLVSKILPFSQKGSEHLIFQSGNITKAILIGQVLVAVIEGILGMIAFFIVGISGAVFWGLVMIILSIIPLVGAFLVWIPAGIFLLLEGQIWQGVFILLWGALIITQVDYFARPKLVNKFADIHPLETFIGVFMGISVFGIIGIVIGPLLISLFRILITVYMKEYGID